MGLLDRFLNPNVEKLADKGKVDALIALLAHEKRPLRIQAIEALLRLDHEAAIPALIEALGDEDTEYVSAAEHGLEHFGNRAKGALAAALGDEERGPKALAFLLKQQEIPTLIEVLRKGDDTARPRAARALAEIMPSLEAETRDAGLKAMRAALGDRQPEIRGLAASLLGEMKDDRAARALAAQLKDGSDQVRKACTRSLQAIGSSSLPHILNALDSRSPRARAEAADLLAQMGPELDAETRSRVIEDLSRASEDRDEKVRSSVAETLKVLG